MRILVWLLCALPCAAQLSQTFSETGYSNGVELPTYAAPNQPAWAHLNCATATEGCMEISTSRVVPLITGGEKRYGAMWTNFDWPADQQATTVYTGLGTDNQNRCLGPMIRAAGSSTSITAYMAILCSTTNIYVGKVEANSWTQIRLINAHTPATGDSINLKVVGTTLTTTVTISGTPTAYNDTDSSISSGRPGIGGYFSGTPGTSSIYIDSWTADYATAGDRATTRYVSMSAGSSTSSGATTGTAWSVAYAFQFCADGMIRAGDTIWLLAGQHTTTSVQGVNISCDGTSGSPINVKSQTKPWGAVFQGNLLGPNGNVLTLSGDYVYVHNVEVTEADGGRRWDQPLSAVALQYQQGVTITGVGSKLIHSLIHNTAQGVFWNTASTEVYGTISIQNFWRSGGRISGHCLYTQLKVPRNVTNNIIGKCGMGIQVSGEDTDQFTATGNTCFEPGFLENGVPAERCFLVQSISTVALTINGATGNPVQISTTADHNAVIDQYVQISGVGGCTSINGDWKVNSIINSTTFTVKNYAGTAQGPCNSSYTSGGTADTGQHTTRSTLTNNLGFSSSITGNPGGLTLHSNNICDVGTITGNYLVGFATNGNIDSTCTNVTNETNDYVGSGGMPRVTWDHATTYTSNTYLTEQPTSGQVLRTRTSTYDDKWLLVTLINYAAATNSYAFDPAAYMSAGSSWTLRDVQNPKVAAATGTWTSGTISLPLNLTSVLAVKGGDWGPALTSVVKSGGGDCNGTTAEGMFVTNLSIGSKLRISGAGDASLNADWTILDTPTGTTFTFSCPSVPNGTHNGGLVQWAGPLLNAHTSNKFNAFLLTWEAAAAASGTRVTGQARCTGQCRIQ